MILSSDMLYSQLSETNYRIYSVKSRKEVSISEIVEDAENYDVIFFGEEHNDSVAHYLQHSLLSTLHKKFASNLTLSLEMFDRDVQTIMNEYLLGLIRKRNFIKDARVWSNYKDYEPLVEFAKDNKLDVVCANAPGRYTNLAGREGQEALMRLSKEAKSYIAPLPYDTASGGYYDKLMALSGHSASPFDSSAKKMPPMGGFNLVLGQSLWDATMAYSISQYLKKNKGKKVLQVNGRFHSDEGFAIVTQLRKYCPKYRSLIISTGSDDSFPAIEWGRFSHLGDYVIITDPAIPKTF
jgi:uncharacterized iron-regulated protein